ncbi:MAG: DEAD/DEAH box helicase [Alphaproteobacteria bacterium]|nr:MAG: DEAD/DEAH box helicase [Alphaproteobacteria bacterium]
MTFKELGLSPTVLAAVEEAGYKEPTPIQAQAIPNVLQGRDVLGIAQTGTGKTAGFTLPMIDRLSRGRAKARMPRSLILEPTRELAAQVAESFEVYGKNNKLSMALLIGGVSFAEQDKKLDRGVDVLIATPGRLLDHCERGKVMLNGVQILVIDEADRMLDMGFIPDIENICKRIPFTRQTLFFSATMPPEIQRLSDAFLQNPVRVEVARQSTTAETVIAKLCKSGSKPFEKRETLRSIIRSQDNIKNGIIFCNRKRDVDILARSLKKHGFEAAPLHGDLDQRVRMATLASFKEGRLKFLVASDVAARGLDIPDVSHVFNFDVPTHAEDYVHRIGRTGRAGREGFAFTIATKAEDKYLKAIEDLTKKKIDLADLGSVAVEEEDAKATKPKRERRRKPKEADEAPSEKKAKAPVDETPEEAAPKRTRSRRSKSDEQKPARKGRPNRHTDDDDVIGLGDHVPAFLQRPIPRL